MALIHCELKSESIRMVTSVNVILPHDIHRNERPVKTLYLLHGRSHNYTVWTRYTSLEQYAEKYQAAIIMPEVNRSFYSNMIYGVDYQDYIAKELPDLCEAMFHISKEPEDRFIAGMSMGGYGALKTMLLQPSRYAACGAISAVTDIRQHLVDTPDGTPKKQEFMGIFGERCEIHPQDDIFALTTRAVASDGETDSVYLAGDNNATTGHKGIIPTNSLPAIHISCGTEDHLYPESLQLFQHLQRLPYPVTFEAWPGIHDWNFWDVAIKKLLEKLFSQQR